MTAELGGGVQVSGHRRPIPTGRDIGAMSLTKLGSGVAMLGYYMYHGGSNPEGKLSTLQESCATGFANNLPEINYDFRAPVRQYGTISDSYREIRLLAYFLQDFGSDFAKLGAEIQPENVKPADTHTLRLSCRHDGEHGYLFFNNYQRRQKMDMHCNVKLCGICNFGNVELPEITIKDGDYGFFPYRVKLGDAILHSALATPLCRLQTGQGEVYVFYGDYDPQFCWEGEKKADIIHLSRKDALLAGRVKQDHEYLILADGFVWEQDGAVIVTGDNETIIRSFPELPEEAVKGFEKSGQEGYFTVYQRHIEKRDTCLETVLCSTDEEKAIYEISVNYGNGENFKEKRQDSYDVLLHLQYQGNRMEIFDGEKKINDYFYTGEEELLSLRYFGFPNQLKVIVYALYEDMPIYLEERPVFKDGCVCSFDKVWAQEDYMQ